MVEGGSGADRGRRDDEVCSRDRDPSPPQGEAHLRGLVEIDLLESDPVEDLEVVEKIVKAVATRSEPQNLDLDDAIDSCSIRLDRFRDRSLNFRNAIRPVILHQRRAVDEDHEEERSLASVS